MPSARPPKCRTHRLFRAHPPPRPLPRRRLLITHSPRSAGPSCRMIVHVCCVCFPCRCSMPWAEYTAELDHPECDIKHTGNGPGSANAAAAFIERLVQPLPAGCHLLLPPPPSLWTLLQSDDGDDLKCLFDPRRALTYGFKPSSTLARCNTSLWTLLQSERREGAAAT